MLFLNHKLRPLLLLSALCTLVLANPSTPSSEAIEKRDLGISILKAEQNGLALTPCGILEGGIGSFEGLLGTGCGLNFGLNVLQRCPLTFKCDGTGTDGYIYDINGYSVPAFLPADWLYFGISVGWQPSESFGCDSAWTIPHEWAPIAHLAPWWSPEPGVALTVPTGFSAPSWWLPSSSWTCSGTGNDGWTFDIDGRLAPSGLWGYMYFGSSLGWLPPAGFEASVSWSVPSGCEIAGATWFGGPPVSWQRPSGFSCPSWWTCTSCSAPVQTNGGSTNSNGGKKSKTSSKCKTKHRQHRQHRRRLDQD